MKAVLISIKPQWAKLIAEGKKTVEVRKTRPKIDVPFKCYIYMTKNKPYCYYFCGGGNMRAKNGMVIGEFVCDKVYDLKFVPKEYYGKPSGTFEQFICENSCLSFDDIKAYGKGKTVFAWHIAHLVIYDKPKELGEFKLPCNHKNDCCTCKHAKYWLDPRDSECKFSHCELELGLTRPPQSWAYCEGV